MEGLGPRLRYSYGLRVIIMGKDPVATEAVTVLALGHQPYGQMVLPIAAKAGQGTMGINNINVRGESLA